MPNPSTVEDLKPIKDELYPRIFQTTYRASSKNQLALSKMIRAMFDDPRVPIESKIFTAWKFYLQGKKIPFKIADDTLRVD